MAALPKAERKTTDKPTEKRFTIRGVTYTLRELSIAEYDQCVLQATDTKQNALGEDIETTDRNRLLRLMVAKSSGLSLAELGALKTPVMFKLNTLVNDMHYVDEPAEEEGAASEPSEDEGDSTGNAG